MSSPTSHLATHERPQWDSNIQYYLVLIGYAVGYGSLWRFPYLVYANGGGAFLIPYFFFVILICFPMLYLETSLGQLLRTSAAGVFNKVGMRFKGIGYAQMIVTFFMGSYYNIILAYSLIFLWHSFSWPLPWKVEDTEGTGILWNPDYFYQDVLNITKSIADLGNLNFPILFFNLLAFIICYLCISKGIKGTGKVVYFTAPAPYVFLFIFLIRGFFLDGAWDGLKFLFQIDFSKLFVFNTWYRAANQVLFQYSIAQGTMFAFASYKDKKEKLTQPAIIVPAITGLTGILCGLTVFTYMGHMAKIAGVPMNELPLSGPDLVFVAYPAALTLMPGSTVWAIMFFIMLFFLGIDTEFAFMETISGFIEDEKISFFGKTYPPGVMRIIIVGALFLAGLPLNFDGGFYFLSFYDDYSTIVPMMLAAFLECYVFGWVYGTGKLDRMIQSATGERFPTYATVCVKYLLIPIFGLLTFVAFAKLIFTDLITLPWWAIIIGLALLLTPIAVIIYYYVKYKDRKSSNSESREQWIELNESFTRSIESNQA